MIMCTAAGSSVVHVCVGWRFTVGCVFTVSTCRLFALHDLHVSSAYVVCMYKSLVLAVCVLCIYSWHVSAMFVCLVYIQCSIYSIVIHI